MTIKNFELKFSEIVPVGVGWSGPFRFGNLFFKPEKPLPWDGYNDRANVDIQAEYEAALIAKSLGVYTPTVNMAVVEIIDGGKRFTTRATVRDWKECRTFSTLGEMCIVCPQVCHRIDMQYIMIVDFWLANYDRRVNNLLYESTTNTLVPIDWDSCFSYDIVPCNIDGVKKIFAHFVESPMLSGMIDFNVLVFGEVYAYIKKRVNYTLLNAFRPELIDRTVLAEDAFRDFFKQFKLGVAPNAGNI